MHIRMPVTYLYIAGLIKFTTSGKVPQLLKTDYKHSSLKNIFRNIHKELLKVFVRGPSKDPAKYGREGLKQLRRLLTQDISSTHEETVRNKVFGNKRMLVVQGAFYILNLGLMIQSLSRTKPKNEKAAIEIVDVIAAAHSYMSIGHATASGVWLSARAASFTKIPYDVKNFRVTQFIKNIGDSLGHKLMLSAAIMAFMDMQKYKKAGDEQKEMRATLDFSLNIAMFTGYLLHKNAEYVTKVGTKILMKFLAREAAMAGANAIPLFGNAVFIIASVISFGMLIWDLCQVDWPYLMEEIFKAPQIKLFDQSWIGFSTSVRFKKIEDILIQYADKEDLPPQLLNTAENRDRIIDVYNFDPYATYTSKKAQGETDKLPIHLARIDDLRVKVGWWVDDGVDWQHLNWRAIIPLHLLGFNTKTIEGAIKGHDENWSGQGYSISSVSNVIMFYKWLKEDQNEYSKTELEAYFRFECDELSSGSIAKLLEIGKFTARQGMKMPYRDAIGLPETSFNFFDYQFYIPEKYTHYGLESFSVYICKEVLKNETVGDDIVNFLKSWFGDGMSETEKQKILLQRAKNWRNVICQSTHDLKMAEQNEKLEYLKRDYHIENWIDKESWLEKYDEFFDSAAYIREAEKKKANDLALCTIEDIEI